ncbi:pyridoxamine 5-phosphate oxidase [Thioclava nitratireducens]|uniref:Pyridoxamine 5-phosphate oxidase n=1 Tax=Thioclava nitratireducens TaxID=1915078 RepID=A0ABN4X9Z5_9RHOB|nr:pyridoxamine 5'-phosphate oxidase family protein [Thioclava nitratireducens]AQS49240.1 pyridoxamine 5-phosphate oxidase [Thioclava nitratireducens]
MPQPTPTTDPIRPTDDEARALAQRLIREARFGALGTLDPDTGAPVVTRVALGPGPQGELLIFVSSLAAHTTALLRDRRAGLLLGEPGPKGDPLTHPRLSLQVEAHAVERDNPAFPTMRDRWLADHPKSKLYIDLPDFFFFDLRPTSASLNGGFGRAFRLMPADLT